MTIEFHCPSCGKFLKTADHTAGVSAKCPDCMVQIRIPYDSEEIEQPTVPPIPSERDPISSSETFSNHFGESVVGESNDTTKTCPYCGETIKAVAIKCRFCGERFSSSPASESEDSHFAYPQGEFRSPEYNSFISSKVTAGICGILLGGFGVHKFILGLNTGGAIMLFIYWCGVVTGFCLIFPFLAPLLLSFVGFIEGILYLSKTDEDFYRTYAIEKRQWF